MVELEAKDAGCHLYVVISDNQPLRVLITHVWPTPYGYSEATAVDASNPMERFVFYGDDDDVRFYRVNPNTRKKKKKPLYLRMR